jgi:hypothetical protein
VRKHVLELTPISSKRKRPKSQKKNALKALERGRIVV